MTDPWTDGESDPLEQIETELLAAYGPNWRTEMLQNLQFDKDAEPIELPPIEGGIVVVRKVFLRLPAPTDRRFEKLGRQQGLTPSQLTSAWIADRIDNTPIEEDPMSENTEEPDPTD